MTDYESLIERAEIETGMDSHAPDCGFVDILDALYWVARVKTADSKYSPWCAIKIVGAGAGGDPLGGVPCPRCRKFLGAENAR